MCIIVVKPKGADVPSENILKECFKNNPDGAGFMYAHRGTVYGVKGLMTYESFIEAVHKVESSVPKIADKSMVFHFRIATHGTKTEGNTHPFPLKKKCSSDYRDFKLTRWTAKQGFAHNGIISKFNLLKDIKKYDVSDTMTFGKQFLQKLSSMTNIATNIPICHLIYAIATSKFAFMDGKGKMCTIGGFIEEENGILFSNSSYKKQRPVVKPSTVYVAPSSKSTHGCKDNSSYLLPPPPTSSNAPIETEYGPYELAENMGYVVLDSTVVAVCDAGEGSSNFGFADDVYDPWTGELLYYSDESNDWETRRWARQMALIDYSSGKVMFNSWKTKIPRELLLPYGLEDTVDEQGQLIGESSEEAGAA